MYKILLIASLWFTGCSLIDKEEGGERAKVVMSNMVRIESSGQLMYFQGAVNYDDNGNGYVMAKIEDDRVVSLTDD